MNGNGAALQAIAQAANSLALLAKALAGEGVSVPEILSLSPSSGHTFSNASARFLEVKDEAERSADYLRGLKRTLTAFAKKGRGKRSLDSFTVEDVEAWLTNGKWSARYRQNLLTELRTFFNWCVRRGLAGHNPASAVELPIIPATVPALHTPAEVRNVLELARKTDLNLCRHLAIRYFAGLRTSEAFRLDESRIKLERGLINVTAASCKTRRRRLVTIQPNLRAWLALGGELHVGDHNTRIARFNAATGLAWPKNVTRHSFCSYHLAHFRDAKETALQAGHSETMLFNTYREIEFPNGELLTADVAADFWSIVPVLESGQAGCPSLASGLVV